MAGWLLHWLVDCPLVVLCRAYEEEPEESIRQCQVLLEEPDLETAVRVGDVYGLMIEHYAGQQNYAKVSGLPQLAQSLSC